MLQKMTRALGPLGKAAARRAVEADHFFFFFFLLSSLTTIGFGLCYVST
jgi:hypothetical protein